MGDFLKYVREGRIPQPTQRTFGLQKWLESVRETISTWDDEDAGLLLSGMIVFQSLEDIRQLLKSAEAQRVSPFLSLIAICAIANNDLSVILKQQNDIMRSLADKHGDVVINKIAEKTLRLDSGLRISPDQLLSTLGDAIKFPIDDALQRFKQSPGKQDNEPADWGEKVIYAFRLGCAYGILSDMWADCLWNNKTIFIAEKKRNRYVLTPIDEEDAKHFAVTDFRQHQIWQQVAMLAQDNWKRQLPELLKRVSVSKKTVTDFDRARAPPYRIDENNAWREDTIPDSIIFQLTAFDDYLAPFLHEPFPNEARLSVKILMTVSDVLSSIVRARLAEVSKRDLTPEQGLQEFSLRTPKADLADVLRKCLGLTNEVANTAITFLTYRIESRGDLWATPLVPLDDDNFSLVGPCILYPNMLRVAEKWLRLGGFQFERRGTYFEKIIRSRIAEAIRSSTKLTDAMIVPNPIRVGPASEEIDILIRVGNVVLVGEAKCHIWPADAIELYRYKEALLTGADQVKRKVAYLKDHLETVREHTKLAPHTELASLQICPFVISNLMLRSGYPMNGVPVIDLLHLERVLGSAEFHRKTLFDPVHGPVPQEVTSYYTNQAEAESTLVDLIREPPPVRIWEGFIRQRLRPMPVMVSPKEMIEFYFDVRLDDPESPWDVDDTGMSS